MVSRKTYDLIDKGSKYGMIAIVAALGVTALVLIIWALSLWFHAEPISFTVFISIVGIAGTITGLYHLREWAVARRKKMDREEKEAIREERKASYVAKYGVDPRRGYNGEEPVYLFDEEPRGWDAELGKVVRSY